MKKLLTGEWLMVHKFVQIAFTDTVREIRVAEGSRNE